MNIFIFCYTTISGGEDYGRRRPTPEELAIICMVRYNCSMKIVHNKESGYCSELMNRINQK